MSVIYTSNIRRIYLLATTYHRLAYRRMASSQLSGLLLATWQEVSRHLDISESTASVAALLCDRISLESLVIRRLDSEHRRIPIVSQWPPTLRPPEEPEISQTEWRRLDRWVRQGRIAHKGDGDSKTDFPLEHQIVCVDADDWIVVPLNGEHGSRGLLISFLPGSHFKRAHVEQIAALQEPLAVALDNDARLHELATLRDAAEAERQSLLRRLGRKDTGDTIVGEQSGLAQV